MCGIAGFLQPGGFFADEAKKYAQDMSGAIAHRGPDDRDEWLDPATGIALIHRRLSILDLSPAGHQPMHSASGRYALILNGEIYNHIDLRADLGARPWRGHSDTETMLAGFETWGVERTLTRMVGMFAFALWDRERCELTLARDRIGEKPLYYGWQGGTLLFGSSVRALQRHPAFDAPIDRDALTPYLRFGYVPAPLTIFRDIRKLPPATFIQFEGREKNQARPVSYWSLRETVEAGLRDPFTGDDTAAIDELERRLTHAISQQRIADVPLGAFLSGGVDSSTVVALMQKQSTQRVKTFSIGFEEADFDEAAHAERVAAHLGTDHTPLRVTMTDVLNLVPAIPAVYDEPFSDSSGSLIISQLARKHVTVALSGDGGDEVFGGYDRYARLGALTNTLHRIPRIARAALGSASLAIPEAVISAGFAPLVVARGRNPSVPIGYRVHLLARYLRDGDEIEFYKGMQSYLSNGTPVSGETSDSSRRLPEIADLRAQRSFRDTMMYCDGVSYLPDDILVKVDRSAMSVALETRVPILDHRVVEFAWRLPLDMKFRSGESKWILRQVLFRHVPRALIDRPKMGFNMPISRWLRGPLRPWAEDLLAEDRIARQGLFDSGFVRKRWTEHIGGGYDWQAILWRLLAFQVWAEENKEAFAGGT